MERGEPATTAGKRDRTEVGSVFVSNYPPYSFWSPEGLPAVREALATPPDPDTPLGLYLHVPFCRKRCKFCYFKVYTEKNSRDVESYLDAMGREVELAAGTPAVAGRPLEFVYVGGGTPSFISSRNLRALTERIRRAISWDGVREVTFECEPGTLTQRKLETIREVGVTRLSLGVENFDDAILEENGRAHLSKEIYQVLPWIRALDFDQLNVDLIAGMVGETWNTWKDSVEKTIEIQPDSVTVYQMELPFNTVYSRGILHDGQPVPVADWATKRAWHQHAFERFEAAGYEVSSAYTVVKRGGGSRFVYRDSVWRGCDLLGAGVSSFSHVGGVHFQNVSGWDAYLEMLGRDALPHERAYRTSPDERLTRELILQLKLGRVDAAYFEDKFGVNPVERFGATFDALARRKLLAVDGGRVRLTRQGLLQVDSLLPEFYAPRHVGARYT